MTFFKTLFGKVSAFFTKGKTIEKSLALLESFGLSDEQIKTLISAVVSLKDEKMPGPKKTDLVADMVLAHHDDAITTGTGTPWPEQALQFLKQVVTIAYLIAKIAGKI